MRRQFLLSICFLCCYIVNTISQVNTIEKENSQKIYFNFSTDSLSETKCPVYIYFKVNKTDIDKGLRENGEKLSDILSSLNSLQKNTTIQLKEIVIDGSASPEGYPFQNQILSHKRAQTLIDYIKGAISFPDSLFRAENLGISWEKLHEIVLREEIPYKEDVLSVLEKKQNGGKKKIDLMNLKWGHPYNYMLEKYFPDLRYASLFLVCEQTNQADTTGVGVETSIAGMVPLQKPDTTLYSREPAQDSKIQSPFKMAIKTNLLHLAATVANLGVEIQIGPHFSLDIPVWYSPYNIKSDRKIRILATQPEFRYWFGTPLRGHSLGIHTHIAGYNIALNDKSRYQDNKALWGAGIGYGYTARIHNHWALEFSFGVGYAHTTYDVYRNVKNGEKYDSGKKNYWGITRAGISLAYQFNLR